MRVKATSLSNLFDYSYRYIDKVIVVAFLERLHLETNTFHLTFGEILTILDNVRYILGIRGEEGHFLRRGWGKRDTTGCSD